MTTKVVSKRSGDVTEAVELTEDNYQEFTGIYPGEGIVKHGDWLVKWGNQYYPYSRKSFGKYFTIVEEKQR